MIAVKPIVMQEAAKDLRRRDKDAEPVLGEFIFMQRPGFEKVRCSVISMIS